MGEVEFDRPPATRLEVDEHQPVLRAEDVPWMRLPVQRLLGRATVTDRVSQISEGVAQELSVFAGERWRLVPARNEPLRLRDSLREVRWRDVDPPHAVVQPRERKRVVGWLDVPRCPRRVVGPKRQREAVTLVDPRLYSRIESGHWAPSGSELLREVDFERGNLVPSTSDSGDDIARQQTQGELVRALKDDRVVSWQVDSAAMDIAAAIARASSDDFKVESAPSSTSVIASTM
jgi:hypothetical protein